MTTVSRRRFLRTLSAGALASAGPTRLSAAQTTPRVGLWNNYVDPIGLFVQPGTTVRFDLLEGAHSVTAYPDRIPEAARPFDSGVFTSGSFEHTFDVPGTYDYYCIPHRSVGMVGRIVVGSPGGPAEQRPIPDGTVPPSSRIVRDEIVTYREWRTGAGRQPGWMGPGMHDGPGGGMRDPRDFDDWTPHMRGPGGVAPPADGIDGLELLGIGLVSVGILGGVLYLARRGTDESRGDDPARRELRRRFDRGEIDRTEFDRRASALDDDREE